MTAMPPRFRLGLVVGKFSPLHLGHELLIETAIAECERVLVLGYSEPELVNCGRELREAWFEARFPQVQSVQLNQEWLKKRCIERQCEFRPIPPNDAADDVHQEFLVWLLTVALGEKPDAMFASEPYVHTCAAKLSRAMCFAVTPVLHDQPRLHRPICASAIRSDVHEHRRWLHVDVYRHFVQRVVLLGGESSGKTTLARLLATQHGTCWVPEFGREHWLARQGVLSLDDLVHIGSTQVAHEEALWREARAFLFCDTSPLTTLGYANWMYQQAPPTLVRLAERPYDLTVLCRPDFEFEQDGTRQGQGFRLEQHHWYERTLRVRGIPFLEVGGPLQARAEKINSALSGGALSSGHRCTSRDLEPQETGFAPPV